MSPNQKKGPARRHFAVDKLSKKGRDLVVRMLSVDVGRKPRYQEIVDALRDQTGEEVTLSSLSRYYHSIVLTRLEEEKEFHQYVRELEETIKTVVKEAPDDSDAAHIVDHLIRSTIVANGGNLSSLDMDVLLREQRLREGQRLQAKKIEHEMLMASGGISENGKRDWFIEGGLAALELIDTIPGIKGPLEECRDDVFRALKERAEAARGEIADRAAKAADNIEKAASKKLDPETLRIIKEEVYGLV